MTYLILFISAFASATLLPLGSEALLIYNIKEGFNKKLVKQKYIDSSKIYFDRFGAFSLLFAWLPIIGDPITFIAGVLRYDFRKFLVLVVISKFSRYVFIALIV